MGEHLDYLVTGDGRLRITGVLSFATVEPLRRAGENILCGNGPQLVDLSGVTRCDSAALAVLLDWLRCAERQGRRLLFLRVPAHLTSIARLCGVHELLRKRHVRFRSAD